jgi:MerR family redox-sensitive transcriptional activator SoxR
MLTIGELAREVGLRTSAIRYYESIGVLPEPERHAGQRRYPRAAICRLELVQVAKRAGFSLAQTRDLLAADAGGAAHAALRELAARRLRDVEAEIERARATRDWLRAASGCGCPTLEVCALFAAA